MHLKICGAIVMFRAVESFDFDQATCTLVVRTVSGKEYRRAVLDESEANKITNALIERMAVCESA